MDLLRSYFKMVPYQGDLFCFCSTGVHIYRIEDWKLKASASLEIIAGAVNDAGIWLGTADDGVWRLSHGLAGEVTWRLAKRLYSSSFPLLQSDNILDLDGYGSTLLVVSDAGVDYLPDLNTVYAFESATVRACANGAAAIVFDSGGTLYHMTPKPTANWTTDDLIQLIDTFNPSDEFNGTDNAAPDSSLWGRSQASSENLAYIYNNNLRFDVDKTSDGGGDQNTYVYSYGKWELSGDFEIIFRLVNYFTSNEYTWWMRLYLYPSGTSYTTTNPDDMIWAGIGNNYTARYLYFGSRAAGSYKINTNISLSGTWADIKLVRDGDQLSVYYKNASYPDEWQLLETDTCFTDDCHVFFRSWVGTYNQTTAGVDVEYFHLISGSVAGASSEMDITNPPALSFGNPGHLLVGHDAGVTTFEGADFIENILTGFGSLARVSKIFAPGETTSAVGVFAYGTSDNADGGQFGLYDQTTDANLATVAGDCFGVWTDALAAFAVHDDTLEIYAWAQELSPAPGATGVRRDWSLYAEIIDILDGIAAGTVVLKINGTTVTPTLTAITNGYRVEYAPAGASNYSARVSVELSAEDANGNAVSRTWSFTTAAPAAATITHSAPPNVVCIRDIGLAASEADEAKDGVNVIWQEDITSALIVNEDQAEAVGKAALDETTWHRHLRTVQIEESDITGADPRDLQQGNIITLTCPAIGMTNQKCEILALQRKVAKSQPTVWVFRLAYYEAVS